MSTLPWELCLSMAASLPRRGTASPCFYSDVSCVVTSGKNIRRNMFCVNEQKKKSQLKVYICMWKWGVIFFWEMSVASCLSTLCLFESPELIDNVKLIHKPVSLQPRGLINKGNWCYINAVSFHSLLTPETSIYLVELSKQQLWLNICMFDFWLSNSFLAWLKSQRAQRTVGAKSLAPCLLLTILCVI